MTYKTYIMLGGILSLAAFLLAYRLSELMMFIGDFGWFYLSARDLLLTGNIPLVGIPSSHPWLHQGPLWTYILAGALKLSSFNPLSGGVVAIIFGLFSVFLIYVLGKTMFGEKVGLIASLLYATSPLVIIHARMPYHTAPIPLFTLLLIFSLYKWLKGSKYYFPLTLFFLVMLYHLELATIIYIGMVILVFFYGLLKKTPYIAILEDRKILFLSVLALLVPMLPILLYDVDHGFPQTMKFVAWIGYKVLTVFGYPQLHPEIAGSTYAEVFPFFFKHMQKLLFLPSFGLALLLLLGSLLYFFFSFFKASRSRTIDTSFVIMGLFLIVGIVGFFATKTTSEAYLPMLFPQIILALALLFTAGLKHIRLRIVTLFLLVLIIVGNIWLLLKTQYLMGVPLGGYGPTFSQRQAVVDQLVKDAGENEYTIVGAGAGCEFESFTMSYAYLAWWKGHEPSKIPQKLQFQVSETPTEIRVERITKK